MPTLEPPLLIGDDSTPLPCSGLVRPALRDAYLMLKRGKVDSLRDGAALSSASNKVLCWLLSWRIIQACAETPKRPAVVMVCYQRCRLVPSLHRQIKPVTMMLEQHMGHDDLMGWGWRAGSVAILHPVIRRLRKSNQSGHCWTVPEHRVCWKFVLPSTSIIALTSSFLWRSVQTFCGT